MTKVYKVKKIAAFVVLAAFILLLTPALYSCERPDIYALIENILQNKNPDSGAEDGFYSFGAGLKIKIDKQLDSVPGELVFEIDGKVKNSKDGGSLCEINVTLVQSPDEGDNMTTTVYKNGDALYFELNGVSKVIADLLCAAGFVDAPVKRLFDNEVAYDGDSVLYFDLSGFDLSMFDEYISQIDNVFTLESNVVYGLPDAPEDFKTEAPEESKILYFDDIKTKVNKGLLKLPYYRYYELQIVIEPGENKDGYINVLALSESGRADLLERVKLDCDLSEVFANPELIYTENILPMRYILELFGETVEWDAAKKQAYTINEDKKTYFAGKVINSKTYINLAQIMTNTDYIVVSAETGEYIEFIFDRRY